MVLVKVVFGVQMASGYMSIDLFSKAARNRTSSTTLGDFENWVSIIGGV